jgi:hypothetical protein
MGGATRNPSKKHFPFGLPVALAGKTGFYQTRRGSCGYLDGLRCAAPILPGAGMIAKREHRLFAGSHMYR